MSRARHALIVFSATLLLTAGTASGEDLTADQQAALRAATSNLNSAEGDLNAAKSSAGTADRPATGSRLKLTQMRLDSANQRLAKVDEALATLPEADEQVRALAQRQLAAKTLAAEIEAIITGGSAPTEPAPGAEGDGDGGGGGDAADAEGDTPPNAPADTPAPAKLHYTDEKKLKDADYYLREVDREEKKAAETLGKFDGEGPKPVYAEVVAALEHLDKAQQRLGLVAKNLEQLPADHPQVKPSVDNYNSARDTVGALRSRLGAIETELAKIAKVENYPKYAEDLEMLREFARRYSDWQGSVQVPETYVKIIADDAAVTREIQRLAETYQPLLDQQTKAGENMLRVMQAFGQNRQGFVTRAVEHKAALPGQIDGDLAEADKMAETAVAESKPGYFGPDGGIAQRLGWAEQKVAVLSAYDGEAAKPYIEKLGATRAAMKEKAKSLEAAIIAANAVPADNYTGEDKQTLIDLATKAWKEKQPDAQVLKAPVVSSAWSRSTEWRHSGNGNFYKIDSSSLQVQLIVKHDDTLAVIRPVNLYKNHLKGDTISASPMDASAEEELWPARYLLLEKLK